MRYVNAKELLPEDLFKQLQAYASGTLLYVPKEGEEKSWEEISNTFGLSQETIKKIIYNKLPLTLAAQLPL